MPSETTSPTVRDAMTKEYLWRYMIVVAGVIFTTAGRVRVGELLNVGSRQRSLVDVVPDLLAWGSFGLAGLLILLVGMTAILQRAVSEPTLS